MTAAAAAPLRVVDLFCGAGGLSEGFRQAGCELVFALDKDVDSIASYTKNHPGVPTHLGSIVDLAPAEIAKMAGGPVDIIVGGPSCQGFSTANRSASKADDERNELWTHMMAVVRELQPRAFLLENVPGMVQFRSGGLGAEVVAAFENLDYVVQHEILMAADYGVPQRRRRLFIVGVRKGLEFNFPLPTHQGVWRRDGAALPDEERAKAGRLRHISVWDAIGDLPNVSIGGAGRYRRVTPSPFANYVRGSERSFTDHEAPSLSVAHERLVSRVPQGGTWRDVPSHLLPERFLKMRRSDSTNLLGRLDPSLPSYTITTQFTNVTTGCNTHPFEDRSLSVREGARLQSFPDSYRFCGVMASRARQIGNAVPPLLSHALAWSIATALLGDSAIVHHRPAPVIAPAARTAPAPFDPVTGKRKAAPESGAFTPVALLASALRKRGFEGFDVVGTHSGPSERAPELQFANQKVGVLVNGCFLGACGEHDSQTRSSTFWWAERIKAYKAEYSNAIARFRQEGWVIETVWEHEDPERAADRVIDVLNGVEERGVLAS